MGRTAFLIFVLLTMVQHLKAQVYPIRFEHFTSENGIENIDIQHILQDRKGFLWLCTSGGLYRYDGHNFQVYQANNTNSSPSNNLIYSAYEDKQGYIWFGTRDGINVFDPDYEQFVQVDIPIDNIRNKSVRHIYEDHTGKIWAAISGIGLLQFEGKARKFLRAFQFTSQPDGISTNYPKFIFEDSQKRLWVGTDNGLHLYDRAKDRWQVFYHSPQAPDQGPANNYIKCLLEDRQGRLWVGTDGGLSVMTMTNGVPVFTHFIHQPGKKGGLSHNYVKSLLEDRQGNLWVATDEGLNLLRKDQSSFEHYLQDDNNPKSLLSNYCRFLYQDRQGIIWIATMSGISYYDSRKSPFLLYRHEKGNPHSLHNNYVRAIWQDKDGIAWIGTNNGIAKMDLPHNTIEIIGKAQGLTSHYIKALAADAQHGLWIGTDHGLCRYDTRNKQITRHQLPIPGVQNLKDQAISCLLTTRQGTLFAGTWKGIYQYLPEQNKFAPILPALHDLILCMYEAENGDIWIGTREGAFCWTARQSPQNAPTRYIYEAQNTSSISGDFIHTFHEAYGKLWIGTSGGGLCSFEPKTQQFELYEEHEILSSGNVYSISSDQDSGLWVGTGRGLVRFHVGQHTLRTYNTNDGLQGNAFNLNAIFRNTKGEILIGGPGGFNVFNPVHIEDNQYLPPVYITGFKIFNKPVRQHPNGPLTKHISATKQIVLSHEDKMISFEFVGLNFHNPSSNLYAYKLENFDRDWHHTSAANRLAVYTSLSPGTYDFLVKAANNHGLWNPEPARIRLIITPPWWQTPWAIGCGIILITALFYLLTRLRVHNLRKAKITLAREVALRTKQLQEEKEKLQEAYSQISEHLRQIQLQRDQIGQQRDSIEVQRRALEQAHRTIQAQNQWLEAKVEERTRALNRAYQELDDFVYRAAHDLRGPIARLLGLVYLAKLEYVNQEVSEYFVKLEHTSQEMNNMLLHLTRSQDVKKRQPVFEQTNLAHLLQNIIQQWPSEVLTRFHLDLSCPPEATFYTDPVLLEILLDNLLDNAITFCDPEQPNKIIRIQASFQPERLLLHIMDNGLGIEAEATERLFDMFFIGHSQSKGSGLGLYEAKLIAEKLQGKIWLDQHPGLTTFSVELPLAIQPAALPLEGTPKSISV